MICGANHHLTSGNKIPKNRLPLQANEVEGITEQVNGANVRDKAKELVPDSGARSKYFYIF
jgi:hypothetical protein